MDSSYHCTCYPRVRGQLPHWPFPTVASSWSMTMKLHSWPCAAGGRPTPLMGTAGLPAWERAGTAHVMPRYQASPLQECQGSHPSLTFLGMPDELWMSQAEFFHALLLLHSSDRQLNCGVQLLSGPHASNTNKKRNLCFLTECSVAGYWESQCLSNVRPLHP